jgi:hypothetical protein
LRSGVPLFEPIEGRSIQPHDLPEAALRVPVMCNLGTKEGVTVKDGRFAGVWTAKEAFFKRMRSENGLIAVAVDPLTSHECGNQRYLAIPWFDACLSARLPKEIGDPLRRMPENDGCVAPLQLDATKVIAPVPAAMFSGEQATSIWLPSQAIAGAWTEYLVDTAVTDTTPPSPPRNVQLMENELSWEADADLESGLSHFIIERDGQAIATVPDKPKQSFGRKLFQGLQYSDTPTVPLTQMRYTIQTADTGLATQYHIRAVNTAGLMSK